MFELEVETKEEPVYSMSVINNFSVAYKATYPLDIIFDQYNLKLYNRIFKFILLIKRAKYSLTINSISIKRMTKVREAKENNESKIPFESEMELEDESVEGRYGGVNTAVVREINLLTRKFGLYQKELLHFVNNLEFFVIVSVKIESKLKILI